MKNTRTVAEAAICYRTSRDHAPARGGVGLSRVLAGTLLGLLVWLPSLAGATHDGSGWYSDAGLDTPDPPGTPTAADTNLTHGGPDGPAEPNFGHSRWGRDWSGTHARVAGGQPDAWGNRTYAPRCQTPTTTLSDSTPAFGELLEDTLDDAPTRYVIREDVGNVSEARDGDATPSLFYDQVWFFASPVGVNVNAALQGTDLDQNGYSDYADWMSTRLTYRPSYEFELADVGFEVAPGADLVAEAQPRAPRVFPTDSGVASWGLVWFGNWTDGADNAGGGGYRDNVINLTGVNETTDNPEWAPYRGAESSLVGFLDPYSFGKVTLDPDDGLGHAGRGADNETGSPPPVDALDPGNDFQNNATNYVVGRVGFLSNPSNATDNASRVWEGAGAFASRPVHTDPAANQDCDVEIQYVPRGDGRYESVSVYLIEDPAPDEQVTITSLHDADGDASLGNGSRWGGGDRADVDQYLCIGGPCGKLAANYDWNQDEMGDEWADYWADMVTTYVFATDDLDQDGLQNRDEFRWELVPMCEGTLRNCRDHEYHPPTRPLGDNWTDGAEVAYWNDPGNDAFAGPDHVALFDPDRLLDTDGDLTRNTFDADSDDDGLLDGDEYGHYGTYPEFADSDCDPNATYCTPSQDSSYADADRLGDPGAGDGVPDGQEAAYWDGSALGDADGDGKPNLLDADSDNDALLDGQEYATGQLGLGDPDTDDDGALDGGEELWDQDVDADGWINAADADADGDTMADAWERQHGFNPIDATDAGLDRDEDGLLNRDEYAYATDPSHIDTDRDLLLDGEEVHVIASSPLWWDTDGDGMADRFEFHHGFQPANATDGPQDPDNDTLDLGQDGILENAWTNAAEYAYGRPPNWTEPTHGPWLYGTHPWLWDTDDDTASDGYEAYYGSDPGVPQDPASDADQDGLNFTTEYARGTDPNDPDTDGDGLCDGGRAPNCTFPGQPGAVLPPGEGDYGTLPWAADSDEDGWGDGVEAARWDALATGIDHDLDGDGVGGVQDSDSDSDLLRDGAEVYQWHTQPDQTDTDNDTLGDGLEATLYHTDPSRADSDQDRLLDADELDRLRTNATRADTDQDGLPDGAEVLDYATDPLRPDSDRDGLPDGWEVAYGTQPRHPDARRDWDRDGLTNLHEYDQGTNPSSSDSDSDGMPDGYEWRNQLDADSPDAGGDRDGDGLTNGDEYEAGSSPLWADSDLDGLSDANEVLTYATDPASQDTDCDGVLDGDELVAWLVFGALAWLQDHDGDGFANNLLDVDADNDGLDDGTEFLVTHTWPRQPDTDMDGLSDHVEVVEAGGRYDPNDSDTDNDGRSDRDEYLLPDDGDPDRDGLRTALEVNYGTSPTNPDTDGDGIKDGPEYNYWRSAWNSGGVNHLTTPDVDGDSIPDGQEIGTIGLPRKTLSQTSPALADTDGDGLPDAAEAVNRVHTSNAQASSGQALGQGVLGAPGDAEPSAASTWEDPRGLTMGLDALGVYIQGSYGVRLYLDDPSSPDLVGPGEPVAPASAGASPCCNARGVESKPTVPDTDGDGLSDGEEVLTYGTDPLDCDSDHDGLGDGLEVGRAGAPGPFATDATCYQRDTDPSNAPTSPTNADTDGDGRSDGPIGDPVGEDANQNGALDLLPQGGTYCGAEGSETSPADLDSDEDGLRDDEEWQGTFTLQPTNPSCWDSDGDGLSDGLETGRTTPVAASGGLGGTSARTFNLYGRSMTTWQPSASGQSLDALCADKDQDGLLDGFEDLDHDGNWGPTDVNAELGQGELDPRVADTDGDRLTDGQELLLWGLAPAPGCEVTGSIPYREAMAVWGGGSRELKYDALNPWEVNPLATDTDADGVLDGFDVNPRADAFFWLRLDQLMVDEKYGHDVGGTNHIELYFDEATIDLPVTDGDFVIRMPEASAVSVPSSGRWENIPPSLAGQVAHHASRVLVDADSWGSLEYEGLPQVRFDLPEDVSAIEPGGSFNVVVKLHARDSDLGVDEDVDFDQGKEEEAAVREFSLVSDYNRAPQELVDPTLAYLVKDRLPFTEHDGDNRPVWQETDRDARLRIQLGDSLPKYFLDLVTTPAGLLDLPASCLGTASCVTRG